MDTKKRVKLASPRRSLLYILLIGLIFSLVLFLWIRDWEQQRIQISFETLASSYVSAIDNEISRHQEAINSVANFHHSLSAANRAAFHAFASAVLLEHHDIQALEWVPRVSHAERQEYELKARQAGFGAFRFTERSAAGGLVEATTRDEYFPVYYVVPHESNERALGFDLASDPVRRKALLRARDSGKTVATGRIRLVQDDNSGQFGYLMFKPVYKGTFPLTIESRRAQLQGYALGVFKIDAFVEEALQDSALGTLDLWIYDQVDTGASELLYFRENTKDEAAVSYLSALIIDSDLAFEMTLNRHGRSWVFKFKPSAHFLNEASSEKAWLVLIAGIALTSFMVLILHRRERYTQMVEQNAQLLAQEKNESEQRYLHLFESNNDALFVVEINERVGPGKFIDVNEAMCRRLGYSKEELLQMTPVDINIPGMEVELQECVAHVLEHKGHLFGTVHVAKDGREISVEINIRALDGSNESLFIACARDVTQRRKAHEAQIEEKEWEMEKLSSALEQTADSIMITDRYGVIEYVNPAFEEITGFTRAEASGKTPTIIKSGRNSSKEYKRLWRTIMHGEVYRNVLINRKKDGSLYYEEKTISPLKDSDGNITHFISSGKDITERMQTEERLHHLAYHDVLTDLPNRVLLVERISNAIKQSRGAEQRCAVLFIDLDRFKNINDTLGHGVGDLLLQAVPERLLSCVRDRDTVARFGGDEFALLLEKVPSSDDVAKVASKLIEVLSKPYLVHNQELYLTASIGISLSPDDSTDANTLIKNADTAMYRAKDTGRNNYQFYSTDMGARAFERLSLETSLRYAMERNEFELFYQSVVAMGSGEIVGAEALIRWHHPDLGLVAPDKFIPLLEDTGLIIDVGEWVINTACQQGSAVIKLIGKPFRMAVNLSGKQFRDEKLVEIVQQAVRVHQFPVSLLDIEITETVLMQNDRVSLANISALKKLGMRLSIDDFGTGYSSLSYLKRFPVDIIKIDRTFIRDVTNDPEDAAIVTAVIAMAHSLKLEVVAEGVEDNAQVEFLKHYTCDYLQGFLFSTALPEKEFHQLLMTKDKML